MVNSLIPDAYDVVIHIDDASVFKIGLAVYLGIIAWKLLGKK